MMTSPVKRHQGVWIFPAVCVLTAIGAALAQRGADPVRLWIFATVIGGWVISLCLHECAHAGVAYAGGDTAVKELGYLTLNPTRYTDRANSLVIPVLLLAIGGIPLPGGSVLIRPGRLRARWWASAVAAAGPATNVLAGIALAAAAAPLDSALGAALSFLALLQFVAAILNILPIPGFDGYGILAPYLPARVTAAMAPYRAWIPLVAFAAIWFLPGVMTTLFDGGYALLEAAGGNRFAAVVGSAAFQFWN